MAAGVAGLADVPVLLAWGPRDPVFGQRYLEDLLERLPQADVQRYPRASHLVTEDAPQTAADVWAWIGARVEPALAGSAPVEPAAAPAAARARGPALGGPAAARRRRARRPSPRCTTG